MMLAGAANERKSQLDRDRFGQPVRMCHGGPDRGHPGTASEYYEIFSRFYAGNGREFHPFMKKMPGSKA